MSETETDTTPATTSGDDGYRDLMGEIHDALGARSSWEEKQRVFYDMRHEGVRRKNKPWATAADMHFPLADMSVGKLKPYYFQQAFAGETLATFRARKQIQRDYADAASRWLDHRLKQRSNFEAFLGIGVDRMLQHGRCPVRVFWDERRKQVRFDALRPQDLVVPEWTRDLASADWIVHIQVWSVAAYKRLGEPFNTDADFIKRIAGKGTNAEGDSADTQKREMREGVTCAKDGKQIVLWTIYTPTGEGWRVRTVSPVHDNEPVRPDFNLPYCKGVFGGEEKMPPFAVLTFEETEERFASPRGVCERVMPFESSLNKDWNTQNDFKTLCCQPLFYSTKQIPNTANLSFKPGTIIPFEVNAVQFPEMPVDIERSMQDTRMVAEQLLQVPDFGMGGQKNPGGNKTATEIQAIAGTMGQGVELRSRQFRREVGLIYRMAWALLLQYDPDDLRYAVEDEYGELPKEGMGDFYDIEPSGSGDNFNREQVVARAYNRRNLFKGSPYIDQGELDKAALEADDPKLVRRLWRNPDQLDASQVQKQAQEITVLLLGFPAPVQPNDDHFAHFTTIGQFLEQRSVNRDPLSPMQLANLCAHALAHAEAMKKGNDPRLAQLAEPVATMQRMMQAAQQAVQQQATQQPQPGAPAPQGAVV